MKTAYTFRTELPKQSTKFPRMVKPKNNTAFLPKRKLPATRPEPKALNPILLIQKRQLKAEEPAKEARATPAKPVALEVTLKAVDILHRKSIQRLNLISRLKQIEAFEVALAQENDELEDNPYQGCKLIIADDKQRQFVTTTPGLIRLVSQFIFSACNEKLSEIEASIVFPNV
jgi:hypothetical protein